MQRHCYRLAGGEIRASEELRPPLNEGGAMLQPPDTPPPDRLTRLGLPVELQALHRVLRLEGRQLL